MVSFRKLFLVLAVLGVIAGTASAQIQSCNASATNLVARYEGLTEPIGTVVMTCSVAPGTASQTANVTLKSPNVNFTNSVASSSSAVTTALATVSVNGTDVGTPVAGVLSADGKQLDFNGLNLAVSPSGTTVSVRLENVRINAFTNSGGPGSIIAATINASTVASGTQQAITIMAPQSVNVATIQTGMTFSVTAGTSALAQCTTPTATPTAATNGATIKFTPGFAFAFRAAQSADNPNGEPAETGAANGGVQLVARFRNVPAGAKLFVQKNLVNAGSTATLTTPTPGSSAGDFVQVTVASDGTATAAWTITAVDAAAPTTAITAGVALVQSSATTLIGLGTAQVNGNLGPISALTTAQVLSSDVAKDPIPRFADVSGTFSNVITVVPCATTLLFPYVTSVTPWETGVAISNTAKDIKLASGNFLFSGSTTDTTGQPGACTLYYFSSTGTTNPDSQTTSSIAPGNQSVFLVGGGGANTNEPNIAARANFSGYILAQCNFLGAHGFAFGTSGSSGVGGFGYEALVLTRSGALSTAESLGQ